MKREKRRVLAVSSGGGHWVELLRLAPAFDGHDITYASVDEAYRADLGGERFHVVHDVTRWNRIRWIQTSWQVLWILLSEMPDVVVSTGALPGYVAIRLARMLRRRTIWIDSIANVDELSMSGQRIGKYADLWLTQWPHLARPSGPHFLGAVL